MQNAEPDYAKDPEVPKNVPIQDANDTKVKEFQTALDAEKKKRRSKPWLVAILSLLLIGLGAVAAIYVYKSFYEQKPAPANNTTTEAPKTQPEAVNSDKALETVKTVLPNTTPATLDYILLALKAPGYDFNTNVGTEDYKSIKSEVAAVDNATKLAEIGKALKTKGLTESISTDNTSYNYSASYKGSDAVCLVLSQGTPDNEQAAHTVTAACTDMSTFKEVAAAQKPFYDEIKKNSRFASASDTSALYDRPVIKTSKTAGYKTATLKYGVANMAAGASMLMFYSTPDNKWHYVTGRGDVGPGPMCSDFNTADAKKAFLGEYCFDEDVAGTVKL